MLKEKPFDLYGDIEANIAKTGRSVLCVLDSPSFSYTVGNHAKGLPELIVIGLSPPDAMALLNAWSELMIDRGRAFDDREMVKLGAGTHFSCMAVECREEAKATWSRQVGQYFGTEDYRLVQILVPDPSGRLPMDPQCHPLYRRVSLLGETLQ